ncbi:MAG: 2-oxo acid dehydrogenase subunit E2 [Candidatus Sericytochromatia bacterium]|nr:2-oxo acid dehydrogenase subunit E2 [Candidatus Sericytochromatia bacterium]
MRNVFASLQNVPCTPVEKVSGFRKLSIGTWRDAYDPSVYGWIFVDADPIDAYLAQQREESGEALTYTHFFTALLAAFFREHPGANALLRFGRPHLRRHITGMVQVAIPADGHHEVDLSGVTLRGLETKSLVEIARAIREQAALVRRGDDKEFAKAKGVLGKIPFWLMFPFIQLTSVLSYTFNLKLKALGLSEDPFGTFLLTNVGSLGMDAGLAPLVPYSRCGLVFTLGKKALRPVVNERGEVEARQQISISVTFDHRLYDGVHMARLVRCIERVCAHPEQVLR